MGRHVLQGKLQHVHLVGSIGLDTVPDIFRATGSILGRRLKRVPDGEPGPRRLWASFQYPLLRSSPYLRPDPGGAVRATSRFPLLCLAEGVGEADIGFGELGYAREARASYLDFCAARARGELAPRQTLHDHSGCVADAALHRGEFAIQTRQLYDIAGLEKVEALPNARQPAHRGEVLDGDPQATKNGVECVVSVDHDVGDRLKRLECCAGCRRE
jgi:hypothetical protein